MKFKELKVGDQFIFDDLPHMEIGDKCLRVDSGFYVFIYSGKVIGAQDVDGGTTLERKVIQLKGTP